MAIVFLTSGAFDFRQIDLFAAHAGYGSAQSVPNGGFVSNSIGMSVGAQSLLISGHFVAADYHVTQSFIGADDMENWTIDNGSGGYTIVRWNGRWTASGSDFDIAGISVDLQAFHDATTTASDADDLVVLKQMFSGNDVVSGSSQDDAFFLGAGDDVFLDTGGDDLIRGGTGNDLLYAGNASGAGQDDSVCGGFGDDILVNNSGNSRLWGHDGNDTLVAGSGDDFLRGGAGADVFVLQQGTGTHRIMDFDPDEDMLILPEATDPNDIVLTQLAGRLQVARGGWVVVLKDVLASDLDSSNMGFDGLAYGEAAQLAFLTGYEYDV